MAKFIDINTTCHCTTCQYHYDNKGKYCIEDDCIKGRIKWIESEVEE